MKRACSKVLISLLVLIAAVVVVPIFIPWTPINCTQQDVDIRTGRVRYSRYLAFCKVFERVEESALSRVLPREMVEGVKPEWERVNTFSPGLGHSPHYRFHGAFGQIREIEILWEAGEVDESTRRKIASRILALWQFDGSYFNADRYIDGLSDLTDINKPGPLVRTIDALEMPEEHVEGDHRVLTMYYPDGRPLERAQGFRDSSGQFVRHGIWEAWYPNGKRECYANLDHGIHHGRRFDWDSDGKLIAIKKFNHNELIEYESQSLVAHPEYAEALRLSGIGPDHRTDGPETRQE